MKKIGIWLFCKFFGFEDKKHIEDFISWNNLYLTKRSVDRKNSKQQRDIKSKSMYL